MSQSDYNKLLQTVLERDLSEKELSELYDLLDQIPNELADFEAVDQLLSKLPDVSVTTNFTSRLINEVGSNIKAREGLSQNFGLWWQRFFTSRYRTIHWAGAASLLLFIGVSGYQLRLSQDRIDMAESLQAVAGLAEITPELLSDFEMINVISHSDPVDEELWAALK